MKYMRMLRLASIAAMTPTVFLGVSTAGASSLKVFGAGASLGTSPVVEASLENETSVSLEDSLGLTGTTCTGSSVAGIISRITPAGQPRGSVTALSVTPCGHSAHVLSKGELEIRNIPGTTNGTVFSYGAKITVFSTPLSKVALPTPAPAPISAP